MERMFGGRWQARLEAKLNDPAWPVNMTVELIQVPYSADALKAMTIQRMADTSKPPISCIFFSSYPDIFEWFKEIEIPVVTAGVLPYLYSDVYERGSKYDYTFTVVNPFQYHFSKVAIKYQEIHVQSVVVWANTNDAKTYGISASYHSCYLGATQFMVPRNIELLGTFTYDSGVDTEDAVRSIIKQTRDLNPDAVIFCDIKMYDLTYYNMQPLIHMKELNYVPKAFTIIITEGTPVGEKLKSDGLLTYVTDTIYGHPKLGGNDYTEDAAPYSSEFRYNFPSTIGDFYLQGTNIGDNPSSSKLFHDYVYSELGRGPTAGMYGLWGAFDIIEQAIYKASLSKSIRAEGVVKGSDLVSYLKQSQASTPLGRVILNEQNINIGEPKYYWCE
jgi:hypothetical protein